MKIYRARCVYVYTFTILPLPSRRKLNKFFKLKTCSIYQSKVYFIWWKN